MILQWAPQETKNREAEIKRCIYLRSKEKRDKKSNNKGTVTAHGCHRFLRKKMIKLKKSCKTSKKT